MDAEGRMEMKRISRITVVGCVAGLVLATSALAQGINGTVPPSFVWAVKGSGSSDQYSGAMAVDSAGNVLVTGVFQDSITFGKTTLNSAGDLDVFVAKFDSTGNLQWAKQAGSDL